MERLIKGASTHGGRHGAGVASGSYEIINEHNQVILPSLWEHLVEPGARIFLRVNLAAAGEAAAGAAGAISAGMPRQGLGAVVESHRSQPQWGAWIYSQGPPRHYHPTRLSDGIMEEERTHSGRSSAMAVIQQGLDIRRRGMETRSIESAPLSSYGEVLGRDRHVDENYISQNALPRSSTIKTFKSWDSQRQRSLSNSTELRSEGMIQELQDDHDDDDDDLTIVDFGKEADGLDEVDSDYNIDDILSRLTNATMQLGNTDTGI